MLHDEAVSFYWPGVEPVGRGEVRDRGLLSSAAARPFQSAFGEEIHTTIERKGAALFHSLIANHPFHNGNKRTAVVALFHFLLANNRCPGVAPTDMYELAKWTATHKAEGVSDREFFEGLCLSITELAIPFSQRRKKAELAQMYRRALGDRRSIRRHPLNREQPPQ